MIIHFLTKYWNWWI